MRSNPPCRTGVNSSLEPALGRHRLQPSQIPSEQRPEEGAHVPGGEGTQSSKVTWGLRVGLWAPHTVLSLSHLALPRHGHLCM